MTFVGTALWRGSVAGLLMSVHVFFIYQIALLFEGPYTAYIYAEAAKEKAAKAAKANKKTK
jgi:methylene-fatty-acyl-phospholipid synthase